MQTSALLPVMVLGAFAAGCQVYDFMPVEPLASSQLTEKLAVVGTQPAPNLMLVVDQSRSMLDPVDAECPAGCATRIGDLKEAMAAFLGAQGHAGRFGLTLFPAAADVCGAGQVRVDLPSGPDDEAALAAHAAVINAHLQAISPAGGTPTARTLLALADHPALNAGDGRQSFVLLLTDGLPNCNEALDSDTCTCTVVSDGQPVSPCLPDARNCLDRSGVVQVMGALLDKDIQTIVLAFGLDASDLTNREALGAMAEAGGFRPPCGRDGDCGTGGICAEGACATRFFSARDALELGQALERIREETQVEDPCQSWISAAPPDERFVVVYVEGEKVPPGPQSWTFRTFAPRGQLTLQGALCERARAATRLQPLGIEVRIVEVL